MDPHEDAWRDHEAVQKSATHLLDSEWQGALETELCDAILRQRACETTTCDAARIVAAVLFCRDRRRFELILMDRIVSHMLTRARPQHDERSLDVGDAQNRLPSGEFVRKAVASMAEAIRDVPCTGDVRRCQFAGDCHRFWGLDDPDGAPRPKADVLVPAKTANADSEANRPSYNTQGSFEAPTTATAPACGNNSPCFCCSSPQQSHKSSDALPLQPASSSPSPACSAVGECKLPVRRGRSASKLPPQGPASLVADFGASRRCSLSACLPHNSGSSSLGDLFAATAHVDKRSSSLLLASGLSVSELRYEPWMDAEEEIMPPRNSARASTLPSRSSPAEDSFTDPNACVSFCRDVFRRSLSEHPEDPLAVVSPFSSCNSLGDFHDLLRGSDRMAFDLGHEGLSGGLLSPGGCGRTHYADEGKWAKQVRFHDSSESTVARQPCPGDFDGRAGLSNGETWQHGPGDFDRRAGLSNGEMPWGLREWAIPAGSACQTVEAPMALLHAKGKCKPCAFFHSKNKACRHGDSCSFCHHSDHAGHSVKQWKKQQQRLRLNGET